MRKSELTREAYAGPRRVCRFNPVMGERCRERATVALTIVSRLTDPDETATSVSLGGARPTRIRRTGYYERGWTRAS